jgi:hypothetical protein
LASASIFNESDRRPATGDAGFLGKTGDAADADAATPMRHSKLHASMHAPACTHNGVASSITHNANTRACPTNQLPNTNDFWAHAT